MLIPVRGARLPRRCVVCNAPEGARLDYKLYRHHPNYYFLLLFSPVVYLMVALMVRKRARFELSLCQQHAGRRRNGLLIGWLGSLVCISGMLLMGMSRQGSPLLQLSLLLALIACPIVGIAMVKIVAAHRIDAHTAWLHVGRPFLDSF